MDEKTLQLVSQQLPAMRQYQIKAALKLMDEGNTIPFIARYRKEATGTLGINNLVLIYETKTQDEVLWGKTSQGWIPMDSVKELS